MEHATTRMGREVERNFEAAIASAEAFLCTASSMLLLRSVGRCRSDSEWSLKRTYRQEVHSIIMLVLFSPLLPVET
jgi:hypothetical protein